jgi:NTE family protein
LDNAFKNERIENLPVRLSIVATNLSEGWEKVFEHWSLLDAVRHSISIPGLFALHHDEDHIYVDGWVVNNLPVRYLDDNDLIVASSCLGIWWFSKRTKSYRGIAIGENVLSFQKRVLSRSIRLMIRKIEDLEITQCRSKVTLIRPRLDKYSVSDFWSVQELIDLGYTEAKNILNWVI